ncbi:hypothetical protein T552_00910 [Pneumocystis carinii B80]|uniref:Very-long-chain (3R)-3-hydroxyacyl-CoA dehydratase n=1 Tax=Pneumocystis carinii (strain B80) TaxID=1408658 RepID=A0A0W4ZN02_PNEC8|nr:hypothetical protein T552_00910 [Pneumocystis carinii B80]KTW29702.1 hypothetical protein T552_00910 [Pneumocystis carinii B80]
MSKHLQFWRFHFYLAGITSSPVFTTIIQVSSRLLLCWGILNVYPPIVLKTSAFFSMSYAWSITEIVRYSYYASIVFPPIQMTYSLILRYNLFYILYPLGTSSEILLIWKTLAYINHEKHAYTLVLKGILMIYIPGFYIMYRHMIHQRRK